MFIIVFIIALIIAIIVLSIRYFLAYAKLTSHKSFDREARRREKELQYEDPVITCEFCGTAIDTFRYNKCPNCGADYSNDPEWIERHKISEQWLDDNANEVAEEEIRKAHAAAKKVARKLKICIITLSAILAACLLLFAVITVFDLNSYYTESEELNKYSFDKFKPVTYQIENGTIIDNEYAKVELTGIYDDASNGYTKLEYTMTNLTSSGVTIRFDRSAINGYVDDRRSGFNYDKIKKNSTIIVYDQIQTPEQAIKTIQFVDFAISDKKSNTLYESDKIVTATTTAPQPDDPTLELESYIFENENVKIGMVTDEKDDTYVMIQNLSDVNYVVTCDEAKVNGDEASTGFIFRSLIPARAVFGSQRLTVYYEDEQYTGNGKLELNLNFVCSDNPEKSFSTGYLRIK